MKNVGQRPSLYLLAAVLLAVGPPAKRGAASPAESQATVTAPLVGIGTLTEFPLPTANSFPDGITAGPDGNLWFTELTGKIGRITTDGVITEFTNAGVSPADIAAGSDGNLWFTDHASPVIGRITTAGVITGFNIPTGNNGHSDITVGPDGNLWITEGNGNGKIGLIAAFGAITEFPIPFGSDPRGIAAGPDGNLWFTERSGNNIRRITTNGAFTGQFTIPTANSSPEGITAGPDGNLWFTEQGGNKIGRITTAGVITEFPIPTVGSAPYAIAAGPDGNLWFTEQAGNKIGRITTAGVITEFPIPTASSSPFFIAAGPDGNIWFTEYGGNKIGRITTGLSAYSFYTLTPCRVADTRQSDAPLGGPALVAAAERGFALTGTCGIPVTARAVSINITVTQPTDQGHLRLYPGGTPLPLVSAINFRAGQTRANNAVVPLGPGGVLGIFCGQASGTVHFILDVNGYFQ